MKSRWKFPIAAALLLLLAFAGFGTYDIHPEGPSPATHGDTLKEPLAPVLVDLTFEQNVDVDEAEEKHNGSTVADLDATPLTNGWALFQHREHVRFRPFYGDYKPVVAQWSGHRDHQPPVRFILRT